MAGVVSGCYTAAQTLPISCPKDIDYTKVKGKTVLVTGGKLLFTGEFDDRSPSDRDLILGSSGLGAAYVRQFANSG